MGLEAATYISDLTATNPLGSDAKSDGDAHLRLIKAVLQATFPNANAAINPTVAEFNTLVGSTAADQGTGIAAGTGWSISAGTGKRLMQMNTRFCKLSINASAGASASLNDICTLPAALRPTEDQYIFGLLNQPGSAVLPGVFKIAQTTGLISVAAFTGTLASGDTLYLQGIFKFL